MKRFIYILLALAGLGSSVSCNPDMLDTNPTDRISGTTLLNTTEGGFQALNGSIRMLWQWGWTTSGNQHQCVGPQGYNLMADLMGEDMIMAAMGNGWFWYDYLYSVKDMWTSSAWRSYDLWNYYYTLISNVNYIINAQETMEGSESDRNYIIGNAYAIRAYCYAYLGMIFARSYIGHEDRLCVPIYTEPTVSGTPGKARATNREVFGMAMSDINNAISLIGSTAKLHVSHFDQYSANGLKARIALYMGDYQTAHDAAAAALAGGASYTFDPSYHFNNASDASVLWGAEIIATQGTTNPQFLAHMDKDFGGYGDAARKCVSEWLYSRIDENDARRAWWTSEVMPDGSTVALQQYKFQFGNKQGSEVTDPTTGADHIFMRAPEMQLIVAETACRLGNETEAREALNALMSSREPGYDCSSLSGTQLGALTTDETGSLLEEIILQRRIELWGEYGRIYDIKRLRQGFERTSDMGHPVDAIAALNSLHTEDPESFDWVMTIPQTEIDANPLILQNPLGSYASGSNEGDDPALAPQSGATGSEGE